jgi:isoquinoline 1-oxidoreductase beta subunit
MTSRRSFIAASAAGAAGFVLALRVPAFGLTSEVPLGAFEPNAYIKIDEDGTVTLWVVRFEMGQGVRTALPMVLAEELDVEWSKVRIEQAQPGGRFAAVQMHPSGSDSSRDTFPILRRAAASAREMLVSAAAARWSVDVADCEAERGVVTHRPSGRTLTYGELASSAAALPVPTAPRYKPTSRYRILGTPMKRVDAAAIATGAARFGTDVYVTGMLYASVERAPRLGATVEGFDQKAALRMPGVRSVLPVTHGIQAGVAIIAEDPWTAMQARRLLRVRWSAGPVSTFDSDAFLAALPNALSGPLLKVRHEGDAVRALAESPKRHSSFYIYPFQAHATLEPMNCTAHVTADRAELWVPTQTDVRTFEQVMKVTGLAKDKITLHCSLVGGGFGRRLFADYAAEAAEISLAVGAPVQVQWTREDDMRAGYFQPATVEHFEAGMNDTGRLNGLVHRTSSSDLTIYDIHGGRNIWTAAPKAAKAADAYESEGDPWGAYDNPYDLPNLKVDCADVTSPVPVGPWRSVAYPSTVFGRESFLDELAHLAGLDPIEYRLALLPPGVKAVAPYRIDRTRLSRVLREVRQRSGWGDAPRSDAGDHIGRGVAVSVYHARSYIAMVATVAVARDLSSIRVEHVFTVVDCGLPLNTLGIEGQVESAIAWGLTATLLGKMDFRNGGAAKTSYTDYRVLRINEMPQLNTTIIRGDDLPGGFGEHAVPLVAPAVANAVFAACGRRVRTLPIDPRALRAADA